MKISYSNFAMKILVSYDLVQTTEILGPIGKIATKISYINFAMKISFTIFAMKISYGIFAIKIWTDIGQLFHNLREGFLAPARHADVRQVTNLSVAAPLNRIQRAKHRYLARMIET